MVWINLILGTINTYVHAYYSQMSPACHIYGPKMHLSSGDYFTNIVKSSSRILYFRISIVLEYLNIASTMKHQRDFITGVSGK